MVLWWMPDMMARLFFLDVDPRTGLSIGSLSSQSPLEISRLLWTVWRAVTGPVLTHLSILTLTITTRVDLRVQARPDLTNRTSLL